MGLIAPKITVTHQAVVAVYGGMTLRQLRDHLLQIPEDLADGAVSINHTDSQREGETTTITVTVKS